VKDRIIAFITICVSIVVSIFFSGCAGRNAVPVEWKPFVELSRTENLMVVHSRQFPERIRSIFAWEYDIDLVKEEVTIWEEVRGNIDEMKDYDFRKFSIERGCEMVILSDESASMTTFRSEIDSVISYIPRSLPISKMMLVRFGANVIPMSGMMTPVEFIEEFPTFTQRANPNGTSLRKGLMYAARSLIGADTTSQRVILILTDDSYGLDEDIERAMDIIYKWGINIVVFSVGNFEHPLLSELGSNSGGLYIPSIESRFNPEELIAFLYHSYVAEYEPLRKDFDGSTHQIIVEFDGFPVKRYGQYKVTGTMNPTMAGELMEDRKRELAEIERQKSEELEKQIAPVILLGIRIPFVGVGNFDLNSTGMNALDSLVAALNELPPEMTGTIRITGYTCDMGAIDFNKKLSEKRAWAVTSYMKERTGDRFIYTSTGLGICEPIRPNDTPDNRQLNRRVEVEIDLDRPEDAPQNAWDKLFSTPDSTQ
jgi:outer membrane protein OmpA-like peptidoglycan-associated protein